MTRIYYIDEVEWPELSIDKLRGAQDAPPFPQRFSNRLEGVETVEPRAAESPDEVADEHGFRVANAEEAMGPYFGKRLSAGWPETKGSAGSDPYLTLHNTSWSLINMEVYDENTPGAVQYNDWWVLTRLPGTDLLFYEYGKAHLRFHPPIEDALVQLAEHFFDQDIPIVTALTAVIRQQRKLTHNVATALRLISRNINLNPAVPGRGLPIDNVEVVASGVWNAAIEIECAGFDCWPNATLLEDTLTLWDAAHANLVIQENANIAANDLKPLDVAAALQAAQQQVGHAHPSVDVNYGLSGNAGLLSIDVTYDVPATPPKEPETVTIRIDIPDGVFTHDIEVPAGAEDIIISTVELEDIDATATITGLNVDVVAQNRIAAESHKVNVIRLP